MMFHEWHYRTIFIIHDIVAWLISLEKDYEGTVTMLSVTPYMRNGEQLWLVIAKIEFGGE